MCLVTQKFTKAFSFFYPFPELCLNHLMNNNVKGHCSDDI